MTDDAHYTVQNQPPLIPFEDFLVTRGFKLIATCDPRAFELNEISFPRVDGYEDSVIRNDYIIRIWRKKNTTTVKPEPIASSSEHPQIVAETPPEQTNESDEHPADEVEDVQARVTVINPEQAGKDRISVAPPPLPSRAPSSSDPPDGQTIRSAPPEGVESDTVIPMTSSAPVISERDAEENQAGDRLIRPPADERTIRPEDGDMVHDDELEVT